MLARITQSTIECSEEEAVARLRAVVAATPELRREHEKIADRWKALAAVFEQARRISGHLEWSTLRLKD